MSRKLLTSLIAALMMLLISSNSSAQQQQPLAVIAVDWNFDGAGAAPRNPELIYKTLKAAFADTLKKKLNVNDPTTVADLEMMRDGQNFRFVIIPKGAAQPTPDEVLAVVKENFMETVTNFFNDFHKQEIAQVRDQD